MTQPTEFGARTDHFNLLTGALADIMEVVDSSSDPVSLSREDARDRFGDIAAAAWHGNTAWGLEEVMTQYVIKSGSVDTDTFKLGLLIADAPRVLALTFELATSNDAWPLITLNGLKGVEAITAPTGHLNTFTLPAITIIGAKFAQLLDFTVAATCDVTASSFSASIDQAQQEDGLGEPIAHGMSGGIMTVEATLQKIDGVLGWTPGGDWTETKKPGTSEGQASWHEGTASMERILERDESE